MKQTKCVVRVSTTCWKDKQSGIHYKRTIKTLKRKSNWDAVRDWFDDAEIDLPCIVNLHIVSDGVYELQPNGYFFDEEIDEWKLVPCSEPMECEQ